MTTSTMVYCYVGSSAGAPEPEALRVLSCDVESGAMSLIQTVKGIEGTSYFQIDRDKRFLYSILGDERKCETKGRAVRFSIDSGRIGKMDVLAELPCPAPCHVSLSPDERFFAFAAYGAGTAGIVSLEDGGVLSYVFPDDAMGPNAKRQKKAYAHCVFFTPDARRLGVVDLGCDRIRFFDSATLSVDATLKIRADAGDGPRHAIWSNDGQFLFVVNELGSSVVSYSFDGASFVRVGKRTLLPQDFNRWMPDGETLATKAAAVRMTEDGKFLLASNRGHDSVAFLAVDGRTGELTLRNVAKLCGHSPRDFALMPGGKFMVVGHELDDEIQSYRIDWETCDLTPVGSPIKAWRPVCMAFGTFMEVK